MSTEETRTGGETAPPLFLVDGDATPAEIAALVVVLQATASAVTAAPAEPKSEWSAPHRMVRPSLTTGPGGWRSSGLPR